MQIIILFVCIWVDCCVYILLIYHIPVWIGPEVVGYQFEITPTISISLSLLFLFVVTFQYFVQLFTGEVAKGAQQMKKKSDKQCLFYTPVSILSMNFSATNIFMQMSNVLIV